VGKLICFHYLKRYQMISNCIILGSGRSGTSMAAGVLAKAGYFMGEKLYPGDEGNPKGYFEGKAVNDINEDLLAQVVPNRPRILSNFIFRTRPVHGQRWLARVQLGISIPCPPRIAERIKALIARGPFCFKDPRFCYTLSVWRPFLRNTVYICVFRHPGVTATSILKECKRERYLRNLSMSFNKALQVWELMYTHALEIHYPQGGDWIFVHYNQFLDGSAFEILEKTLGVEVDRNFVDPRLKRSTTSNAVPQHTLSLYQKLCHLAGYRDPC